MSRPLNIAHRGGAGLWPENTMAAFAGAAEMGVHGFELDVHITRDGEVAVYHDDALKPEITRGPDGTWITRRDMLLKDMTFAELQAFDVGRAAPGSRYAAEHPATAWADGAKVPHLREVLALVRGTALQVWIELKSNFVEPGRTVAPYVFAEKVVTLIRAERAEANAVIIGFDWRALVAAQRLAPDLPVWFTTLPQSWFGPDDPPLAHWPPPEPLYQNFRAWDRTEAPWAAGFDKARHGGLLPAIKAAGAQGWFPFHPDLDASSVARARAHGLKVGGWTVNAEADMQRLIGLGVEAVCTDYPDRLSALSRS